MTERLFVAAWPDPTTADVVREIPRPDERGVRWVPEERWHVTLRFLGRCAREDVESRLAGATLPHARAHLGPAVDWLGRQLVVPVSGVDELAGAVRSITDGIGEPPESTFRGHLTIARTHPDASSTVLGHPVEASFVVSEVALVRSDLTSDGPRYTIVATFPTT